MPKSPSDIVKFITDTAFARMTKKVGPHPDFTVATQSYAALGIGRVCSEAVQLSLDAAQHDRGKPNVKRQKVRWNLEFRTNPIPIPGWNIGITKPGPGDTQPPYVGPRYAPDEFETVRRIDAENPGLCARDPAAFTILVARELHTHDPNWGLKSRIGGPISRDTLAYKRPDGLLEVIDMIRGAGTGNGRPQWNNLGPVASAEWHDPL